MKPFIATTIWGGAHPNYLDSLVKFCATYGAPFTFRQEMGDGIGAARDRCAGNFLRSDCTDLLFIDSDIGFSVADVRRILSHDVDVVGGCYPLKQDGTPTLVLSPIELSEPGPNGLQECHAVGTGFLRIRRNVFEEMREEYAGLAYTSDNGLLEHHYFDSYVEGGRLWGEDIGFCRRWRAMGGKIFADYGIRLNHSGNKIFRCEPELQSKPQTKG